MMLLCGFIVNINDRLKSFLSLLDGINPLRLIKAI